MNLQQHMANSTLMQQLALSNVRYFTRAYGGFKLSEGQAKLAGWIARYPHGQPDGMLRQAICKVHRGGGKTLSASSAYAYLHALDKTWKILVHPSESNRNNHSTGIRTSISLRAYPKTICFLDVYLAIWFVCMGLLVGDVDRRARKCCGG